MDYRNYETEDSSIYCDHAVCFFDEINKRLKLEKDGVWMLSEQEMINGLKRKTNAAKIVQERKEKGFTIKQVGKKIKVFTGVKPEDLHEKKADKNIASLEGMATFRGFAKGIVKIIIDPFEDNKKFKNNEILVTPMTTPEFGPLMKRAGAIITDEGGILCHAAIVSRELKTPCIIGTKVASQVLKDGDMVEVDANNGIVKILKQ